MIFIRKIPVFIFRSVNENTHFYFGSSPFLQLYLIPELKRYLFTLGSDDFYKIYKLFRRNIDMILYAQLKTVVFDLSKCSDILKL